MKLTPTAPPGRSTRKARRFAHEIGELRAQGYTFEAIRQALAAVGIDVSITTVQREAARAAKPGVALLAEPPAVRQRASPPAEPRDGKAIAEAFMRDQITNPLLRAKEQRR